jgi:serine/threonine protein kinase
MSQFLPEKEVGDHASNVIGQGKFGCVHKPSLKCKDKTNVDYTNKISKIMEDKDATIEMGEYDTIDQIDKKQDFYLGKPIRCKVDDQNEKNIEAIRNCGKGEELLNNIKELSLILLDDGGMDLHQYAIHLYKMYESGEESEIIIKIEQLLYEALRILRGLQVFNKHSVVHRDLKPSNLLYDEQKDRLNFIDFGFMTKKSDILDQARKNDYRYLYWWNFPIEIQFYNRCVFDRFVNDVKGHTGAINEDFINQIRNFDEKKIRAELIKLNRFDETKIDEKLMEIKNKVIPIKNKIKYADRIQNLNHIDDFFKHIGNSNANRFKLDYNQFITHELQKFEYEDFLEKSVNTFDVYGIGITFLFFIGCFKPLFDEELYIDLNNFFYQMITPDLNKRMTVDDSLKNYQSLLIKHGIMDDENQENENTVVPDKPVNTTDIEQPTSVSAIETEKPPIEVIDYDEATKSAVENKEVVCPIDQFSNTLSSETNRDTDMTRKRQRDLNDSPPRKSKKRTIRGGRRGGREEKRKKRSLKSTKKRKNKTLKYSVKN